MDNQQLQEDFEDFFESSLCGFITANSKGEILRCNSRLAGWLHYQKETLTGRRFSSLLPIGGRMYYETHLSPLLRLQGFFDEVAIEITDANGERLPFLLNGCERRDADGSLLFVRFILFKASDRYIYEQNLGSGISLDKEIIALEPVLTHVIDELRSGWAARNIETHFSLSLPVNCDSARISQLLSNLVANALTHGLPEGTVRVFAAASEESFELSVSNAGKPIPQLTLTTLFEPFTRENTSPSKHGLGLGLYISSEIARAHGGTLTVVSDVEETCFTFRMART